MKDIFQKTILLNIWADLYLFDRINELEIIAEVENDSLQIGYKL